MGEGYARIRQIPLKHGGAGGDTLYVVVKVENLSAPAKLLFNGFKDNSPVVFHNIGLHRVAILRSLLYGGHIADAAHRHIQGSRNGGGGKGEHVHGGFQLLEPLLVGDAEALLLVYDAKPQILKFHILLQNTVSSDNYIHLSAFQAANYFLLLLRSAEA